MADRQGDTARDDALGDPFDARTELRDEVKLIRLSGTLAAECTERLAQEVERDESRRPAALLLDLRGLTFIDSAGIALLLKTRAWALDRGVELVLVRGTGQVKRALELVGIDRELRMVDDDSEVLGHAG